MIRPWLWLFPTAVLASDAALVVLMLNAGPADSRLPAYLIAHMAACLLFSLTLARLLPEQYRKPAYAPFLFFSVIVTLIPVLGMIGLLAFVIPALRRPAMTARATEMVHFHNTNPPIRITEPRTAGSMPRSADLAGQLQYAADPQARTSALIATLSLDNQYAAPLLRLGLKDPDDDVRLLSYALLNRREKSIEARINMRRSKLDSASPDESFVQHKALAHDYWELGHLGIAHGSTMMSMCARSREHVLAALQLRARDGGLQFLLGRILLLERKLDAASAAFENARESGVDARQISAFLAEIAFLSQRFPDVKRHLIEAGIGRTRLRLNKALAYWEAPKSDRVQS